MEPTDIMGGHIWAGSQVKQSYGLSMCRANSVRTGIRETGACVHGLPGIRTHQGVWGCCPQTSSRRGIGLGQGGDRGEFQVAHSPLGTLRGK